MKSLKAGVAAKNAFSLTNRTHKRVPSLKTFLDLKERVLGKQYDLSLVFCGKALSHKLNRLYRGKDKPTNILSFPLSDTSGEIFIDLDTSDRELEKFDMNREKFLKYLFIHGCLHLKGMEHGDTMRQHELRFLNVSTNSSRY